jgi:hypothetical protein
MKNLTKQTTTRSAPRPQHGLDPTRRIRKLAVATAFASILATADLGTLQAADNSPILTMKPLQGISFDVGTKRAASYFLREDGMCKLVLTLAEAPTWDDVSRFTATRFEAAINAGNATRYDSPEGKSLDFACLADAQAMSVRPVDEVAVGPAR